MRKRVVCPGLKTEKLTVLRKAEDKPGKWICRCECGAIREIDGRQLRGKNKVRQCWDCGVKSRAKAHTRKLNPGDRYEGWTVVEFDKERSGGRSGSYYLCKCDCGKTESVRSANLVRGLTKKCRKCVTEGLTGKNNRYWTGYKDIPGSYWRGILRRSHLPRREVTITIEQAWDKYVEQQGRCAITNVPIQFGAERTNETTASLDRIDSSRGYHIDNIQWVHKRVNAMKSDLSLDEFVEWCRKVVESQNGKGTV